MNKHIEELYKQETGKEALKELPSPVMYVKVTEHRTEYIMWLEDKVFKSMYEKELDNSKPMEMPK
jgi:hypothetical protein